MTPKVLKRSEKIKALHDRDCPDQPPGRYACFYCSKILTEDQVTLDHFLPKAAGGTWDLWNLRIACRRCNNSKADRVPGADGSIPAPPPRQQRRAVKRQNRPDQCSTCTSGRTLASDETCIDCGRSALPANRSHTTKRRTWECDHHQTWCVACCLLTADEKRQMQRLAISEAFTGVNEFLAMVSSA